MAISPEQLAAAEKAEQDAQAALTAAEAQEQTVLADPRTAALEGPKATAAVSNARFALRAAAQKNRGAIAQAQRENKPLTPAQENAIRRAEDMEATYNRTGIYESSAAAQTRADRAARTGQVTPLQAQTANTASQRAATDATRVASVAETAAIKNQTDAINNAATITKGTAVDVANEAKDRYEAGIKNVTTVQGAGQGILTALIQEREQNIKLREQRSSFIGSVLTTALPQVAQMVMKIPKGSKAAQNFLKAFLVMGNMAYKSSGLDVDLPGIDWNSPEMLNLKKIAGYKLNDTLPEFPSADQITWQTTKRLMALGMPPPGANGPIGPAALDLPDDPETIRRVGGKLTDAQLKTEVINSPEGKTMEAEARARIPAIMAKVDAKQPLTPEEKAQLDSVTTDLFRKVDERVALVRQQRADEAAAGNDPKYQFKKEIRKTMEGADDDKKLNIMSAAVAGQQNRLEGKPLTSEQQITLDNLDEEDLRSIQENITPDVAALLTKRASGQKLTDIEISYIKSRVSAASSRIVAKPMVAPSRVTTPPPPAPKPVAAATVNERQPAIPLLGPTPTAAGFGAAPSSDAAAVETPPVAVRKPDPIMDLTATFGGQKEQDTSLSSSTQTGGQDYSHGGLMEQPVASSKPSFQAPSLFNFNTTERPVVDPIEDEDEAEEESLYANSGGGRKSLFDPGFRMF